VVAIADGVCGPCREPVQALVIQRRKMHRTRGCLSCREPVLLQNVWDAARAAVPLVQPSP